MEVEIKLHVKPSVAGGPLAFLTRMTKERHLGGFALGHLRQHEIWDLYYDTADGALAAAGAGLRSRMVDGKALITLKMNRVQEGALTQREEFEEPLDQERVDWVLSHVKDLVGEGPFPARAFFEGKPCGPLAPVLKVGTARLERPVGTVATLVLDVVKYPDLAPTAYFDLEVEATGGMAGEASLRTIETALHNLAGGQLMPATASKLERGLALKAQSTAR
ncbi:MAG TPA: CYTH domain-containing protein [Symbiobacteriaceae bacterium]